MAVWKPIAEIVASVKAGDVKAIDLVEKSLQIIADKTEYNAIIVTTETRARERAADIDARVANGETIGRLAGVPFIAKDNFLVFGADTTAASNILKGFDAPYQATAIEKLEAEGAICVAKANLDAFAHGSSTENSDFMTTLNPHDKTKVPGGSSGGSAAAVVLEMAPFTLGTDTGGSIRLPASFTGCVGYKPTYGLVSRSGVVAMASSADVVGPFALTVADAAIVLDVMSGQDALDSTTIARASESYVPDGEYTLAGKKVGIVKEYMGEGVSDDVRTQITKAIAAMKDQGAEVEEISLPSLPLGLAVYYIVCPAEVSSNLSRYDGQRYGYTHPEATDLEESFSKTRAKGFGKEAKRRIMLGTYVLSSGYFDAYYNRAQTVRTKIINEYKQAFSHVDFLVGPVAPNTAFGIGENVADPLKMYLGDIMTASANLAGVPAISVPCGIGSDGMPIGLQIIANQHEDRALLACAQTMEGAVS